MFVGTQTRRHAGLCEPWARLARYCTVNTPLTNSEDDININQLHEHQKWLFTGPKGSKSEEWTEVSAAGTDSTKAIKIHRGAAAAEIHRKYPQRVIPSRLHHTWKDKGQNTTMV